MLFKPMSLKETKKFYNQLLAEKKRLQKENKDFSALKIMLEDIQFFTNSLTNGTKFDKEKKTMFGKKNKDDKNSKKDKKVTGENIPAKKINGEPQMKIPKGYKATVSKDGTIIMVSRNVDLTKPAGKCSEPKPDAPKPTTPKPKAPASQPKKPAGKRSEPKPTEPKKSGSTPAPKPAAKKTGTDKLLKHNDKDEMQISAEKPIIINGKNAKSKSAPKVLRRVAKTGGYTAWDARTGKTFATEKEAIDYAADVLKKTGKIVEVTPTDRQVTHTFKAEEKKTNK